MPIMMGTSATSTLVLFDDFDVEAVFTLVFICMVMSVWIPSSFLVVVLLQLPDEQSTSILVVFLLDFWGLLVKSAAMKSNFAEISLDVTGMLRMSPNIAGYLHVPVLR